MALWRRQGARQELAVDGEIKVKSRQSSTQPLTILLIKPKPELNTPFQLVQVIVGQLMIGAFPTAAAAVAAIVIHYDTVPPPLLEEEDLAAPPLPRNVPRRLAHRQLLRQLALLAGAAALSPQPRRHQIHLPEILHRRRRRSPLGLIIHDLQTLHIICPPNDVVLLIRFRRFDT